MIRPATNKAKKFVQALKDWNDKRLFDKLTPGQKTAYLKKLLAQDETKKR